MGSEDIFLINSREDNATARTAKLLAVPPTLASERLSVLLQPLAAENVSPLTSMALLEVVAAIAVGELGCGDAHCPGGCGVLCRPLLTSS